MLLENKMEEVSNEIKNQFNLLSDKLPDCEEKTKTLMKIIISKYKEVTDINCRGILCDFVVKDNNLLKISNEFFIHILDGFDFEPESLNPYSENDKNPFMKCCENNILLAKINNIKSSELKWNILKENLKYIFKFKILQYFERLENQEDNLKADNDTKIRNEIELYLGNDAFQYFKNAYATLMDIYKKKQLDIPNQNFVLFIAMYF